MQLVEGSGVDALGSLAVVINVEHRIPESLSMHIVHNDARISLGTRNDIAPLNESHFVVIR